MIPKFPVRVTIAGECGPFQMLYLTDASRLQPPGGMEWAIGYSFHNLEEQGTHGCVSGRLILSSPPDARTAAAHVLARFWELLDA